MKTFIFVAQYLRWNWKHKTCARRWRRRALVGWLNELIVKTMR